MYYERESKDLAQYLAFGIVTGGFLLLATLGFALVARVEKFLNIAHAQLISVGALATWFLSVDLGLPFLIAAGLAVIITALVGLLVARIVYEPMLEQGPAIMLITSVGVVFVFQGVIEAIVSPGIRSYDLPKIQSWDFGAFRFHPYHLAMVGVALAAVVGLHAFLTRTKVGTSIRALTDNRELAEIRGVDVKQATRYVWLAASGLAGLAGVALGVLGTITTRLAFDQILLILSVAILAGLGSIYGVVAAAFALGIAMDLSVQWLPAGYRTAVAFVTIILVLLIRPEGIAGGAKRRTA
jgi:branched-chain amino acid transport system permease protein